MTFETEREIQIHVANHMIGESASPFPVCVFIFVSVSSLGFLSAQPSLWPSPRPLSPRSAQHTGVRQTGEMNSSISEAATALDSCSIV